MYVGDITGLGTIYLTPICCAHLKILEAWILKPYLVSPCTMDRRIWSWLGHP